MTNPVLYKLTDKLYLIRYNDTEIKFFEALWEIPEGITYNSYIYLGKKTILFDTLKKGKCKEFIQSVEKIIDPKKIDYLVIHHMEPDHSGCIDEIVKYNPNVTILGHPLVNKMISAFYGIDNYNFRAVKDNEVLEINDVKLRFIYTPWLHWPETIMTYLEDDKILFTGDVFGSYSIPDDIYADKTDEKYIKYMMKYFVTVIGHYRQHVLKNLEKLSKLRLDPKITAPLHGALWNDYDYLVHLYSSWAKAENTNKVTVIYSSMYGYVETVIRKIINELAKKGYDINVYRFTDIQHSPISDILMDALDSKAIVIGAATYESSVFPYMKYVVQLLIDKVNSKKKILIVSSYGWGGVAGRLLKKMFEQSQFEIIDVIEFNNARIHGILERITSVINEL